ncbi:MAG: DUF3800 domain-containing protein [Oscillospiraceae bacterium]
MDTYYLFLDELKANEIYTHFCLGGCIIEDIKYRKEVIPFVENLKERVFNNRTKILHEVDIGENNEAFWSEFKKVFTDFNIKTLCVGIDVNKFRNTYKQTASSHNSEYYVALQIIIENFVHFLDENNGIGSVYIESRGLKEDFRLKEQYDRIYREGTLFIPHETFEKRIFSISFPMKADNNIGIQLADFIPNPIAREFSGIPQKKFSLFDAIKSCAYDGNNSLVQRFGIKKVL